MEQDHAMETLTARLGEWLFRHRSYTLVPLGALVIAAAWTKGWPWEPGSLEAWLLRAAGIGLLLLGEAIRWNVAARALPGTSGRGTTLRAHTLVTHGAYAWVRNPLYLANGLLWVGAACLTLQFGVVVLVVAVVGLQYHLIILAEEGFLERRFGQGYRDYCARTPRLFPRPFALRGSDDTEMPPTKPDWTKALFREHDTIYLIFLGVWGVLALQAGGTFSADWYMAIAIATLGWLGVKILKKRRRKSEKRSLGDTC